MVAQLEGATAAAGRGGHATSGANGLDATQRELPRVLPDEPRLLVMREGEAGEPLLILPPGNMGTVMSRRRLALALPATVWGIEHGYLRTASASYLAPATLEEYAADYADMIRHAMETHHHSRVHLFGGSFDALLGAKLAVALRAAGTDVGLTILLDPPPPGPCNDFGSFFDHRLVAAWAVRASRVAGGGHAETRIEEILSLFRTCEDATESSVRAVELMDQARARNAQTRAGPGSLLTSQLTQHAAFSAARLSQPAGGW